MIKERLRFKKEHQLSTCSSSAAITARTRNNSSIDTNDSTRITAYKVHSPVPQPNSEKYHHPLMTA